MRSGTRRCGPSRSAKLGGVDDIFADVLAQFTRASSGFERVLRAVAADQWHAPTPCSAWDVRQLVNHMARGNLNYVQLVAGGSAAEFLALRDADALGADPVAAFVRSAAACAEAFARPGALDRILDYPLGRVPGRQGLAVRTADAVVHTWDLARAVGAAEALDPELVAWVEGGLTAIYAGLDEGPTAGGSRFFAAPLPLAGSRQDRLLRTMGRNP